ncbi:MAG: hypothetical protein HY236_01620 [Acidobacteria bacterium]|nr:hypothetical protein [Acidobacteriota bacterium]
MPGAAKKPSRKALVEEYLRRNRPAEIDAPALAALRRYVIEGLGEGARVSNRYLLDLLESTDVPIARELGGLPPDLRGRVHFHDLAAAEASLRDLLQEDEMARAAANSRRLEDCRHAVLQAKERLEMILRRAGLSPAKRAEKAGWSCASGRYNKNSAAKPRSCSGLSFRIGPHAVDGVHPIVNRASRALGRQVEYLWWSCQDWGFRVYDGPARTKMVSRGA